jgi:hypothetical protein
MKLSRYGDTVPADDARTAPKKRPDDYPSVEDAKEAIGIVTERGGLTPNPHSGMYGPYASDEWKQWIQEHWPLPRLRVVCGHCGGRLDHWALHLSAVAMPSNRRWDEQQSDVLQFTEDIRDQRGYLRQNKTHDGRDTLTYVCDRRDCATPHRAYRLSGVRRTLLYLEALRAGDKVIRLN